MIKFFYKFILLNIYKFIQLQISKSIEYRSDEQASLVVGGPNMAYALNLLGSNGYFSIFSTHPTTKNRTKNVKNIKIQEVGTIKPVFGSSLAVILSFVMIIVILERTYKLAELNTLIENYREIRALVQGKFFSTRNRVIILINRFFNS
jgi:hypothetical protein